MADEASAPCRGLRGEPGAGARAQLRPAVRGDGACRADGQRRHLLRQPLREANRLHGGTSRGRALLGVYQRVQLIADEPLVNPPRAAPA